jgi:ubiquinone/menaquinone biosynthesis C-methylase UbiE
MTEQNEENLETGVYTRMTADVYDAIYSKKSYESEAERLKGIINKYKQTDGNELLDVACGTGLHLPYLVDQFEVTGIDLSEEQIKGAKERLPRINFVVGDMRTFDLHKQFDIVTCLFSSIGYMQSEADLSKAIVNMSKHLKPGGVLVIEPWLQPDAFDPDRPPHTEIGELSDKKLKVTRTATNSIDGNISILNMHNVVEGPNGTEEFDEQHRLAMYTPEQISESLKEAGLRPSYDSQGLSSRGLHIAIKSLT